MGLTPVEIRHVPIGRGLWGYRRGAVERLLDEVADSFEEVWRERADFADRIEHLEGELSRHRELESLLRRTLVSAEAAAQEQREAARRDAEHIVAEAHAEGRRITFAATAERERLEGEIRRLRELLRTALASLEARSEDDEDTAAGDPAPAEAA
jgi:cell division initiation protein